MILSRKVQTNWQLICYHFKKHLKLGEKEERKYGKEEEDKEGRVRVKCQVLKLFVHLFMPLPVFVAESHTRGQIALLLTDICAQAILG